MKCLPICFGINIEKDIPVFFGAFYKFLYYCQENNWPILAQEEYYENPIIQEKKYPIKLSEVSKINDIPSIKSINVAKKNKYIITKKETESIIKNYEDKDDAWIRLMNEEDSNLFNLLENKINKIIKKHNDIRYIIIWRYNATIEKICKKFKFKLINLEMSGFRKPSYNFTLCYYQHKSKYSDIEFNKRYEKFSEELKSKKVNILTRNQLLKLMVSKKEIDNIVEEEYYTGFAMGLAKDYDTISTKSKTNNEILEEISKTEDNTNLLIRKHPSNNHYIYDHEDEFVLDHSVSSIQFLSRCHRMISSVSNIGAEAMLFGKTCYILGEMPFKKFGYQSLDFDDEYVINLQDLNFLIFCYFVPYEIVLTKEYLEFRDSNPTEIEIYEYHYKYIMDKYGKNLKKSGIKSKKQEWTDSKKELNYLRKHTAEVENKLNSILYSRSWKILAPLRIIKRIFKREN